ncbi:MAG: hypothetical protein V4760_07235 [Bdellovibrionota bacterium]
MRRCRTDFSSTGPTPLPSDDVWITRPMIPSAMNTVSVDAMIMPITVAKIFFRNWATGLS